MHNSYTDITRLIAQQPKWHDEHAVPRYCDFHPNQLANIYAAEAALALITCQACQTAFHVAVSETNALHLMWDPKTKEKTALLSDLIAAQTLTYGDPPNTQCGDAGPSMSSVPVCVLEYWFKPYIRAQNREKLSRLSDMMWTRDPRFETPLKGIAGV